MATLKAQIESHLPITLSAGQITEAISYLTEIQRILLFLVDEEDLVHYKSETAVDANGVDITLMRCIEAFKGGRRAPLYPQHTFELMSDAAYTGIYKVHANAPASVIKDSKIYIFPGGGKLVSAGVQVVSDLETDTQVTSLPLPFRIACVYYVAIQFLKELLNSINENKAEVGQEPTIALNPTFPTLSREVFNDAIALAAHPSAPLDPTLSADQATAPNVDAANITSPAMDDTAGTGETYNKENLSLDYTEVDARQVNDDIEMVNGAIQKLQKKVEEATANMRDELNRVNSLIAGYQSKVQHSIEQGRLTSTASNSEASLKLQQELQNAQNKLQAAIEEKRLLFTKYQAEVSSVVAENRGLIDEFQSNMSLWAKKSDINVAEFTTQTDQILRKYQTDVQSEFETHSAEVRKISTNTGVVDSKIQGYIQSINLLTNQFTQAVQSYITSVQMRNVKYNPAPINAGDAS